MTKFRVEIPQLVNKLFIGERFIRWLELPNLLIAGVGTIFLVLKEVQGREGLVSEGDFVTSAQYERNLFMSLL